ncbi:hypothetical protein TNIN_286431 [Trichonephila inaurata madagascariensis]|uniref:Uncharacterized protein n=1 Tax=Trichonephila inaurata madagascariensis TaxID=2747483 RepID=A0A8X6Y0Z3_9ARAC|nr:hypothetical protein TNIN_286431 [Trichonephila inaurata madagascariensis]
MYPGDTPIFPYSQQNTFCKFISDPPDLEVWWDKGFVFDKAPQKEVIGRHVQRPRRPFQQRFIISSTVVGYVHSDTFSRHYGNEEAPNHRKHKMPSVVGWAPC